MSKVSVCIPVYNGAKYLAQTIKSVQNQTYQNFTLLVQDNHSTDETWSITDELAKTDARISPAQNAKNIGMAANWNAVMDRASTEYVMLLSADDLLEPNFLEVAMQKFEADTELGSAAFNFSVIENGVKRVRNIGLVGGRFSKRADLILSKNPFSINFTIYKKTFLDSMRRHGKIFGHFYTCDFGLHIRVAASGVPFLYVDEPLGIYRFHGENLSLQAFRMRRQKILTITSLRKNILPKYAWSYRYGILRPLVGSLVFFIKTGKLDRKLWKVAPRRILRTFFGRN